MAVSVHGSWQGTTVNIEAEHEIQYVDDIVGTVVIGIHRVVAGKILAKKELLKNVDDILDIDGSVSVRITAPEGQWCTLDAVVLLVTELLQTVEAVYREAIHECRALIFGTIAVQTLFLDASGRNLAVGVTGVPRIGAVATLETVRLEMLGPSRTLIGSPATVDTLVLELVRSHGATLRTGLRLVLLTVFAHATRQEVCGSAPTLLLCFVTTTPRITAFFDTGLDFILDPLEAARIVMTCPVSTSRLAALIVVHAAV